MLSFAFNTATGLLTSVTSRLPARMLNNLDLLRKSRRVNNSLAIVGEKLVAARDTATGKWVEGTLIVKSAKVPSRLPETPARADGWPPCFKPPASHRASPTNGFT